MGMDSELLIINPGFYEYNLDHGLQRIKHAYTKKFIGDSGSEKENILHVVCRQHLEAKVIEEIRSAFPFDNDDYHRLNWNETQILVMRDNHTKFYALLNIEPIEEDN